MTMPPDEAANPNEATDPVAEEPATDEFALFGNFSFFSPYELKNDDIKVTVTWPPDSFGPTYLPFLLEMIHKILRAKNGELLSKTAHQIRWRSSPAKDRLYEYRRKSRLSQAELAERSGISQARISRYENGRESLGVKTVEKLAKVLNCHPAELL